VTVGLTTVTEVIVLLVPSGRVFVLKVVLLEGVCVDESDVVLLASVVVSDDVEVVDLEEEELIGCVWVCMLVVVESALLIDDVEVGWSGVVSVGESVGGVPDPVSVWVWVSVSVGVGLSVGPGLTVGLTVGTMTVGAEEGRGSDGDVRPLPPLSWRFSFPWRSPAKMLSQSLFDSASSVEGTEFSSKRARSLLNESRLAVSWSWATLAKAVLAWRVRRGRRTKSFIVTVIWGELEQYEKKNDRISWLENSERRKKPEGFRKKYQAFKDKRNERWYHKDIVWFVQRAAVPW
jgi:hypothetical protein